jgi:hypothetical protein
MITEFKETIFCWKQMNFLLAVYREAHRVINEKPDLNLDINMSSKFSNKPEH